MKKQIVIAVFVLFVINARAQDQNQVVKINPLGAFFGAAQLSYEKAFNEKNSFVISPSFGFFNSGDLKYTTYGIGGEYRFYIGRDKIAPEGLYVAPGIGYSFGKAKVNDGSGTSLSVGGLTAHGLLGYQWIYSSGFSLDLGAGIQYFNLQFTGNDGNSSIYGTPFSGILPALSFSIGYAF